MTSSNKQFPYDIVIVSPNGALDSYYLLPSLEIAAVNRASRAFHTAGGKGNNMARAAKLLGGSVLSVGIVGGYAGKFIEKELESEGIAHDLIWSEVESRRSNTIFVEGKPDTTVILEPGQPVGDEAMEELTRRVLAHADDAPFIVFTGSLPPGFPADYYGNLKARIPSQARICVDSTGEVLRQAALSGVSLVKVNQEEFCLAFGDEASPFCRSFAITAYDELRQLGLETLIITDGADGAYALTGDQAPFIVRTKVDTWVSTAGAGDTFMAGLLLALVRGEDIREAVCFASAAAAANLQQMGCGFFDPQDVDRFLALTTVRVWDEG